MIDDLTVLTNSAIPWLGGQLLDTYQFRLISERNKGVKVATFNDTVFRHTYDLEFELVDHFKNQWQLKNIKLTKFIPEVQILKLINED